MKIELWVTSDGTTLEDEGNYITKEKLLTYKRQIRELKLAYNDLLKGCQCTELELLEKYKNYRVIENEWGESVSQTFDEEKFKCKVCGNEYHKELDNGTVRKILNDNFYLGVVL